jgi:hypothetical protein
VLGEAGTADADGLFVVASPPVFFGELREGD